MGSGVSFGEVLSGLHVSGQFVKTKSVEQSGVEPRSSDRLLTTPSVPHRPSCILPRIYV